MMPSLGFSCWFWGVIVVLATLAFGLYLGRYVKDRDEKKDD
jgi:hypothetical protein